MKILKDNAISIGIRFIGAAATAAMSIAVLQKFGPSENGIFQSCVAICILLSTVFRVGQDNIILNIAINNFGSMDMSSYYKNTINSSATSFIIGSVFALIFIFISLLFPINSFSYLMPFIPTMVIIGPLWIVTESLRGVQRLNNWALWQGAFPPIVFLFLLLQPVAFQDNKQDYLALFLFAGYFFSLLFALIALKIGASHSSGVQEKYSLRRSITRFLDRIRAGLTFWLLAMISALAASTDIFVLAWVSDTYTVGIYQPLIRIGGIIAVFINLLSASFVTPLAISLKTNPAISFYKYFINLSISVFFIALFLGLTMMYFGDLILNQVSIHLLPYQIEYNLYIITQIFQSVFILSIMLSIIVGLERVILKIQVYSIFGKALLIVLGYHVFQIRGVLLAIMTVTVISNLVIFYLFRKEIFSNNTSQLSN